MALPIKKFREIVFQFLYSREFEQIDREEMIPFVMRQQLISKKQAKAAFDVAEAIWALRDDLDRKIDSKVIDYDFDRIAWVELALLRYGTYELFHGILPPKVAIAESLRIARKFATAEGASFINGVLDALYKEREEAGAPTSTEPAAQ